MEQPLTQHAVDISNEGSGTPAPRPLPIQDLQTLSQLKRGNWAAMEQLVLRYQDRLLATTLRIVGHPEDAADLVQETFVKAMQNVATFEGKSSLYTWLFRIAVNLSLSHQRAAKYRRHASLDADLTINQQAANLKSSLPQDTELDPAEAAEQHMEHAAILNALAKIDADFRTVIVLRDIEDCDYQQIAEILELPIGTIKSRLFRARAALREILSPSRPAMEGGAA